MGYTRTMTRVRAAVTERPGHIRVHEYPLPEPGAVLMILRYSGIFGTDKQARQEAVELAQTDSAMKIVMASNGCD
jgi:threonine dehydrogenase-like Zn-dependent dehydrogenase